MRLSRQRRLLALHVKLPHLQDSAADLASVRLHSNRLLLLLPRNKFRLPHMGTLAILHIP
jgi:hypothetical protein